MVSKVNWDNPNWEPNKISIPIMPRVPFQLATKQGVQRGNAICYATIEQVGLPTLYLTESDYGNHVTYTEKTLREYFIMMELPVDGYEKWLSDRQALIDLHHKK